MKQFFRSILCKIGFHNWSKWSEPDNRFIFLGITIQQRTCKSCNYTEAKI